MFFGRKNNTVKKAVLIVMALFLLFSFAVKPVSATMLVADSFGAALKMSDTIMGKIHEVLKYVWYKSGSVALQSAIRNALNTIAYDTATYIGSGKDGQKPLFVTESWGEYLKNVGDNAAGTFIETLGTGFASSTDPNQNKFFKNFNLCEPKFDVKLKIGLGLVNQHRPPQPDCTASELLKNWENEALRLAAMREVDFLKKFSGIFNPTSNDLGIALSLQTGIMEDIRTKEKEKSDELVAKKGWLDIRNIGGIAETFPGKYEMEIGATVGASMKNIGVFTGDALIDAANTFMNQLAVTSLSTAMNKLSGIGSYSSPYSGDFGGLLDYAAGPHTSGVSGAKEVLKKIIEPKFSVRGDYNILAELSTCNQGQFGIGPTNCVIDERMRQTIEQQKTVGEAVREGLLRKDLPFGFIASGQIPIEPRYNEGISYRSMLILRKFRIIPVGWEIAAEHIRSNPDVINNAYLGKMIECFENGKKEEKDRQGYYSAWCDGLVDPDWVLKAPQNYCAREGYGPQIIFEKVMPGYGTGDDVYDPEYTIIRADSYCADEQSCIKERNDGSCEYFGYCSEEKRQWKFGADSCNPVYNTCQTYVSEKGQSISFLKNTLNFCEADQYGCEKYAIAGVGSYDTEKKAVDWNKSTQFLYLNKEAQSCSAKEEGCDEFIRVKEGLGANLIYDSGFEDSGRVSYEDGFIGRWPVKATNAEITGNGPANSSGKVLKLTGNTEVDLHSFDHSSSVATRESVLPAGFVMEPEISYTITAEVYLEQGERAGIAFGRSGSTMEKVETTSTGRWERLSLSVYNNLEINANQFKVYGQGSGDVVLYIDNLQFEAGDKPTAYKDYRGAGLVYEKVIPSYLEEACYKDVAKNDFAIKDNASNICFNYASKCSREEAGCEMYSNKSLNIDIPAKVTNLDYCASECVGYNTYIQSENNFSASRVEYFIPKTAQTCSAAAIGCEEFTNLDELAKGGEAKEYFSYLRQCVKPNTPGVNCAEFYAWEGSASQGQQLVKYSLESAADGSPEMTSSNEGECSEDIYNLLPSDASYNSDCRQFYDRDGDIFYRLYSRTISCSQDCHPYRLTYKNKVERSFKQCVGSEFYYDAGNSACYRCQNGGTWNTEHNACVYLAVPSESRKCPSNSAGCSEYNGNAGANINMILNSTFENENHDGWTLQNENPITLSKESVIAGMNSADVPAKTNIQNKIKDPINKDSSYIITFLARGNGRDVNLELQFSNDDGEKVSFGEVVVSSNIWKLYKLDIINFPYKGKDEILTITNDNTAGVYLDNIRLTEIKDRYFLVRNSWRTPASCDRDIYGNPYPLFALGCSQYSDRFGSAHYLHNFSLLCQESAVGCEAMIKTHNYSQPFALTEVAGKEVDVPADRLFYAVFDPKKQCNQADKGCQFLGLATEYENESLYKGVYFKNNPDIYEKILCDEDGVGCDKWRSSSGDDYFKNPGEMVCEYRQGQGVGQDGWGWYKKKIKRCAGTGNICASDDDCPISVSCRLETDDKPCPTDNLKTIGQGGLGNEILQPINWAGLCPAKESGCAEYIDPVSDFSANVVFNPDFSQDISGNKLGDGWGDKENKFQSIKLDGNNLYILAVKGGEINNTATVSAGNAGAVFYELLPDNTFASAVSSISVGLNQSKIFYTEKNIRNIITVLNNNVKGDQNDSEIILRKAVAEYQIASGVDKKTCNGVANFSDGCIWFNERTVDKSESGFVSLNNNAWKMYPGSDSIEGNNNSNQLLKVRPDRVCATWLACKSYINDEKGKNVCFDIGACNRLDDNGACANFLVFEDDGFSNRTYDPAIPNYENKETIKNLSGYAKVGKDIYDPFFKNIPNNLYDFGNMRQIGKNAFVPNGDFESYDPKTKLAGSWLPYSSVEWTTSTAENLFSVIADPLTAQNHGIEYPVSGKSFLKYNAGNPAGNPTSEVIYVDPGAKYYLSFYINTLALRGITAAEAEISILSDYGVSDSPVKVAVIEVARDKDWMLVVHEFTPPKDAIHLRLGATNGASGSIYIDDIQISPTLLARGEKETGNPDILKDPFYISQSCRLYPQENSLSCEYFDESGIIQKGERGYCLEYDRAPGNPDACLLWWPIDKVQGQGLSTGIYGYSDRMPLYYCTEGPERPYIDASSVYYEVDEATYFEVNGVRVNKTYGSLDDWFGYEHGRTILNPFPPYMPITIGRTSEYQQGYLSQRLKTDLSNNIVEGNKIYLNYGVNTIKIGLASKNNFGETYLYMNGDFYYDENNKSGLTKGSFNLTYPNDNTPEVGEYGYGGGSIKNCWCKEDVPNIGEKTSWYLTIPNNDGECDCENGHAMNDRTITFDINISPYECFKLANVVTRDGRNKAWADRVKEGSTYEISCNREMPLSVYEYFTSLGDGDVPSSTCAYSSDYQPFGSIVPPDGTLNFLSQPQLWSRETEGKPLFYQFPDTKNSKPPEYQARMGQLHSSATLPYLFAESYGIWEWNSNDKIYQRTNEKWTGPTNLCENNRRTRLDQNCAVSPTISNIAANGLVNLWVFGRGFVNLTFNSHVDAEQMPLVSYEVDWGDGEVLSVSGVEMRDRPEAEKPHSAFHAYDYYTLKYKNQSSDGLLMVDCEEPEGKTAYCTVIPRVKIKDNWGWCSEARYGQADGPDVSCPDVNNGVCMNSQREFWPNQVFNCQRNKYLSNPNFGCPNAYPICSDGWYELNGAIKVFEK